MNTHTIQLMDFYPNFQQGTFIPKWSANLCGGYGCPIYLIEYILPYYLASLFHFVGFSFLLSTKLTLVLAFVLSGIAMYLWAKEEFGKVPGFVAAIFYLYAPYHLIDFHFRGSSGEVLSFVFIPLLCLFMKKLIELGKKQYFFLLSVTLFLLLLSHANTTLIALPLAVGYGIVVWIRKKKRGWRDILLTFSSLFYGILLASFYWIPAMDGVKYTWLSHTTFGDFKPITEYLYSPILYGFLFQGHQGEYRLIVGYLHLLAVLFAIYLLWKNRIEKNLRLLLLYLLFAFGVLFFMLLEVSKPIWQNIPLLHSFIIVWRLLVPIAFITSAIAAICIKKITNIYIVGAICLLVIYSTIPNWANRAMVPLPSKPFIHEQEYFTEYFEKGNAVFEESYNKRVFQIADIVSNPPKQPIIFIKGKGEFKQVKRTHVSHEYVLHVQEDSIIRENTNYFPGWKVFVNNKETPINYKDKNNLGKIVFHVKEGIYKVDVKYTKTPVVLISEMISIISIFGGILFLLFSYRLRKLYKQK